MNDKEQDVRVQKALSKMMSAQQTKKLYEASPSGQKTLKNQNWFFLNFGINLVCKGDTEKTFCSLSCGTGLDKGLSNTKGVGLLSNGKKAPGKVQSVIGAFERKFIEPQIDGEESLEEGEFFIHEFGSTIAPEKRRADGIALAREMGLTQEEAEKLANAFLRPDSSQIAFKIYRRHANASEVVKPQEEENVEF